MTVFTFRGLNGVGQNYDEAVYGSSDTYYEYDSFSSTQIKEYNDSKNYFLIEGVGFTRSGDGTIQRIVFSENGIKAVEISSLSIAVKKVLEFENDPEGFGLVLTQNNDIVNGSEFSDLWRAGSGNDRMYGGAGNDKLYGNSGNDRLLGQSGKDLLNGGAGNDELKGGSSADHLNGGAGADKFIYGTPTEGNDDITLFDALDFLVFEGTNFKLGTYAGILKEANFLSRATSNKAVDKNDYFIFNRSTDTLWFDADGSGTKQAVEIADFSNDFSLRFTDILIA